MECCYTYVNIRRKTYEIAGRNLYERVADATVRRMQR